jgi:hypothetical protein
MEAHASDLAERLGELTSGYYMDPDCTMHPKAEVLLMARACARRGMRQAVRRLWWALTPVDSAVDAFATGLHHQLILAFGERGLARRELLDRHRAWVGQFQSHYYRAHVQRRAEILEDMLAEEAAPAPTDPARRLIRQLWDQDQPLAAWADGWSDEWYFFPPPPAKLAPGPVEQLAALGFDAVPGLIDALDDDSLTRCVWYFGRYGGSLQVLPVRLYANYALRAISGLALFHSPFDDPGEAKQTWSRWWELVSRRGEEEALADLASEGGTACVAAAIRLLDRWPRRFRSVLAGAERAQDAYVRECLIRTVATCPGEGVTAALVDELKKPRALTRIEAAEALLARGRREGLYHYMRMWLEQDPFERAYGMNRELGDVARLLLTSRDPEAVAALRRGLFTRPSMRRHVLGMLLANELSRLVASEVPQARAEAELEGHMEGVLLDLLDDLEPLDESRSEVRVADRAARRLAEFWPSRYSFDVTAPLDARDRALERMQALRSDR